MIFGGIDVMSRSGHTRIVACLALSTALFAVEVAACTIEISPLRKDFRRANSVFTGKLLSIDALKPNTSDEEKIPDSWSDWKEFSKVKFQVERKWKGSFARELEFVAAAYYTCACDTRMSQFAVGKSYLVFAETRDFVSICSAEEIGRTTTTNTMKRLDSFWFRTWARIYPF